MSNLGYIQAKELLHGSIRKYVESKHPPTHQALREAYDGISQLRTQWDNIAGDFDFALTPSAPDEAPLGLEHTGSSVGHHLGKRLYVCKIG